MTPDDRLIDDLAEAFLDGNPIDWAATKGTTSGPLVTQLKIVAAVAEAHRQGSVSNVDDPAKAVTSTPLESWGHLRIRERIGRGAFGEVYRAWDTRLDRAVALKLIPISESSGSATSSTIEEGRLLARVGHPNVVTIYGADRIGDYVGLWMEFVPGRTLEELLREGRRFTPSEVVRIGLELARALSAVHAAGLLHRDIKGQNVMRADDGRVLLMDFGSGRDLAEAKSDMTGTPLYLAPEVLQGQQATPRSDIYSLGVLLYHLLTTSYPVNGTSVQDLRLAHEQGVRVGLHLLRPDLPAHLVRVIEHAIERRAGSRYADADKLSSELEALVQRRRRWPWFPYALLAIPGLALILISNRWHPLAYPLFDSLMLVSVFAFSATICRGVIRALALAVSLATVSYGAVSVIDIVTYPSWWRVGMLKTASAELSLLGYMQVGADLLEFSRIGFMLLLLWFAFMNHRGADVSPERTWRQLRMLAIYVAASLALYAAPSVGWKLFN